MSFLGLLTLGVFVGTLIGISVKKTTDWSDSVKVIVGLIGAAFSGVVFGFIEKMLGTNLGDSLFMYPVGLTWSLIWIEAEQAVKNVRSNNFSQKIIGWLHIGAIVLGTVLVLLLLLSEDFRNLLPSDVQPTPNSANG